MNGPRHLEVELNVIRERLLAMGAMVEESLEFVGRGLMQRQADCFARVFEIEKNINREHVQIDELCLEALARLQPVASDLRLILAAVKINTDLERMGDQVVNIAHNAEKYISHPVIAPGADIARMFAETRKMLSNTLDAFVRQDRALAVDVLKNDSIVDALKHQTFREVLAHMSAHPADVEQGLNLILISRNLERMADHATNIAEDTIFVSTGEDIRHGSSTVGQVSNDAKKDIDH